MDQSVRAEHVPILIIGCGFGGMALAIELKKAGMNDFVILERAGDIGGSWRDNTYPGAACDVVSRFYSFSYDQDYEWSTAFAPQPEIWDYCAEGVDRHGIRPHVRFNTEVSEAAFDEETANMDGGDRRRARGSRRRSWCPRSVCSITPTFRISQAATISRASASIPRTGTTTLRSSGKTVAVIGCGASAVQFIPKIAPQVEKLELYQRSPQYVMPKAIFRAPANWTPGCKSAGGCAAWRG